MVRDVKRLDPGALMRIGADGRLIEYRSYWRLPPSAPQADQKAALEIARSRLSRATAEHMVADVPLGVFLSGGVDSSAIAALAQRSTEQQVKTYNIRFDEVDYDESAYALQVADKLGTDHHEVRLTQDMFTKHLDDALYVSGLVAYVGDVA